jgi:hypothetical protein
MCTNHCLATLPLGGLLSAPSTRTAKDPMGKPRSRWCATLGAGDHLVAWLQPRDGPDGMGAAQVARRPDDLTVRARRYQGQRHGLRVKTITWVTTLMHAEHDGVAALSALSCARWGMETHVAQVNTTMALDVLTWKTVDGVLKELLTCILIDNFVRLVMGQAARRQPVDIDRIRCIDAARWRAAARDDAPLPTLVRNPPRPSRDAPRVRKRRPKPYPRLKNARQELRHSLATNSATD